MYLDLTVNLTYTVPNDFVVRVYQVLSWVLFYYAYSIYIYPIKILATCQVRIFYVSTAVVALLFDVASARPSEELQPVLRGRRMSVKNAAHQGLGRLPGLRTSRAA